MYYYYFFVASSEAVSFPVQKIPYSHRLDLFLTKKINQNLETAINNADV